MCKKHMILISGKAQAGKNTFALGLYGFFEYAFANQLKTFAKQLGWNGNKDERGRKFLQDLATVVRTYNQRTWVNLMCNTLVADKYPDKVAITDCRYFNEINVMRRWGKNNGYRVDTIRIERPGHDSMLTEEAKNHPSETELDNYLVDHVVMNTGTITDLLKMASNCFTAGAYNYTIGNSWPVDASSERRV